MFYAKRTVNYEGTDISRDQFFSFYTKEERDVFCLKRLANKVLAKNVKSEIQTLNSIGLCSSAEEINIGTYFWVTIY